MIEPFYPKNLQEVAANLEKIPVRKSQDEIAKMQKYYGTGMQLIGLTVPQQRKCFKNGYSFSNLTCNNQIEIWHYVWNSSHVFEHMQQSFFYCESLKTKSELTEVWPYVKKWVRKVDNWAHSDALSAIYSRTLDLVPDLVYPTLSKWNKSGNPWKRRQSIVSLTYYSTLRNNVLPYMEHVELVTPLLHDKNYYVQKGIGWTLRELGNVYPEQTWDFLQENSLHISATAFSAATEKLEKEQRELLKEMRRNR
jgi:3-methyladenine DNA glycosylase AlkD